MRSTENVCQLSKKSQSKNKIKSREVSSVEIVKLRVGSRKFIKRKYLLEYLKKPTSAWKHYGHGRLSIGGGYDKSERFRYHVTTKLIKYWSD